MDEQRCEDCGRTADEILKANGVVAPMVQMQPGNDGKPWYLCARCWCDGMHPFGAIVEGKEPPVPIVNDPRIADALEASGWTKVPANDAKPKAKRKRKAS